jgi:hypothetical protein
MNAIILYIYDTSMCTRRRFNGDLVVTNAPYRLFWEDDIGRVHKVASLVYRQACDFRLLIDLALHFQDHLFQLGVAFNTRKLREFSCDGFVAEGDHPSSHSEVELSC